MDRMNKNENTHVVGVYSTREEAIRVIENLKDEGYRSEDISIIAQNSDDAQRMADETGTEAGSGAAGGAVTGGILGGIGGWLVGAGLLTIPGIGPLLAAGPIAAALGGAVAGAGAGGLVGALVGMGIPEEEASVYEERVKAGDYLVMVRDHEYDNTRGILGENPYSAPWDTKDNDTTLL